MEAEKKGMSGMNNKKINDGVVDTRDRFYMSFSVEECAESGS